MAKNELVFLSVIVPVYQAEKYLPKLMHSILQQNYQHYEVVLIDDGSTDGSGKICDEYATKNMQIRVIHTYNRGVSAARNTGLNIAEGEYIIFADADDWFDKKAFYAIYKMCKQTKNDLIIFGHYIVDEEVQIRIEPPYNGSKSVNELKIELEKFLNSDSINAVWNKVFKRKVIIENKLFFPEQKIGEDAIFSFLYISKCEYIFFANECYYYYYQNNESVVHNYSSTRWIDEISMIKALENLLFEWGFIERDRKILLSRKYQNAILFELYNILTPECPMIFDRKISYLKNIIQDYEDACMWKEMRCEKLNLAICIQIFLLKKGWCGWLLLLMNLKKYINRITHRTKVNL